MSVIFWYDINVSTCDINGSRGDLLMSWLYDFSIIYSIIDPALQMCVCVCILCSCVTLQPESCQWCSKHKCLNIWYLMILILWLRHDWASGCVDVMVTSTGVELLLILCSCGSRRREPRPLESVVIRRTPCAGAAALRPTTCRSPPAGSVATPRSARESVSGLLNIWINTLTLKGFLTDLH